VNEHGVFVWSNPAFIELFGDRRGEHYSSLVAPEHRAEVDAQFERKRHGASATDYVIEGVTRDGRRVPMDVSSVRLDRSTFCGAVFGMAVVGTPTAAPEAQAHLTPRQHQVLGLLARGASTDQIADELLLRRVTVRNHISDILRALDAHSRLEAVVKARSQNLVND
jgi:DNA-binding NarL/FixJ family response regulator